MRERWNRARLRLNGLLTRRRRIVLDLLLTAAVLGLTWAWSGWTLPGEAAFRRLERQNFLSPGEIVFHQPGGRDFSGAGRLAKEIYISLGEDWAAVGYLDNQGDYRYMKPVGPGTYTMVPVEAQWMELWALEPGPVVVPLLFPVRDPEGTDALGWGAAALRLPAETAGGVLRLTDREGREHVLTGARCEEGALWFWEVNDREKQYYEGTNLYVLGPPWMPGLGYSLELYDEAGEAVARLDGTVLQEREG